MHIEETSEKEKESLESEREWTEIISRMEWIACASCEVNPSGTNCECRLSRSSCCTYSSIDMCFCIGVFHTVAGVVCVSYGFFCCGCCHCSYIIVTITNARYRRYGRARCSGWRSGISFALIIYMRWDVTVIYFEAMQWRTENNRVSVYVCDRERERKSE